MLSAVRSEERKSIPISPYPRSYKSELITVDPASSKTLDIAPSSRAHSQTSPENCSWIVERTFAWISRNRRLPRDFERYAATAAAFIRLAMIRIMLRRLAANLSL